MSVVKCFVMEGMESALGRKKKQNSRRKVTKDAEAESVRLSARIHLKAGRFGRCRQLQMN